MGKLGIAAIVTGAVVVAVVAFVITLLLIKLLAWTIPDLFPGAVQQKLIADQIGWLTAAKVALFIAVLAGIARGSAHGEATVKS